MTTMVVDLGLPLKSTPYLERLPSVLSLPGRRRRHSHVGQCSRRHDSRQHSGGVSEETNRARPAGSKRFALSYLPEVDHKDRYHDLWMVDYTETRDQGNGGSSGVVGQYTAEHLMRFERDTHFQPSLDRWPRLVTQATRGLNLAVTAACIRVLDLHRKDSTRIPGSYGLDLAQEFPCAIQQSASMEYTPRTGEYKIIRMLASPLRVPGSVGYKYRCETYTLGTNAMWVAADAPPPTYGIDLRCLCSSPVRAHGAHHWLDCCIGVEEFPYQVVAFNANEGSYKSMPFRPDGHLSACVPKMFLDWDSGNVCLLAVLQEEIPKVAHRENEDPVELWMLCTDAPRSGNALWVKRWEGYLPHEVAASPIVMESQKLLFSTYRNSLSWYDLHGKTTQVLAGNVFKDTEGAGNDANDRGSCRKPQTSTQIPPSVAVFGEEMAPPEILDNERRTIHFL